MQLSHSRDAWISGMYSDIQNRFLRLPFLACATNLDGDGCLFLCVSRHVTTELCYHDELGEHLSTEQFAHRCA